MKDTHTFTASAWITNPTHPEAQWYVTHSDQDMTSAKWVKVGEVEVTIPVKAPPRAEIVAELTKSLRGDQDKIREKCSEEISRIEQRIQNLLAIEYSAPPKPVDEDDSIPF